MSRFSRTTDTPDASAAATPASRPAAPPSGAAMSDLVARHQALQARGQEQNVLLAKFKGRLEHVIEEDQDLTTQAQALGANTPDELLQKIEAQDRADAEALDQYEAALDKERQLLDSIERELDALDAAE